MLPEDKLPCLGIVIVSLPKFESYCHAAGEMMYYPIYYSFTPIAPSEGFILLPS